MLPTVDFCGLTVTRLIIGANPFGGYSHQNRERDQEEPERVPDPGSVHRFRARSIWRWASRSASRIRCWIT